MVDIVHHDTIFQSSLQCSMVGSSYVAYDVKVDDAVFCRLGFLSMKGVHSFDEFRSPATKNVDFNKRVC